MIKFPTLTKKKQTLRRKLFAYMFALVALLGLLLFIGLLLVNGYSGFPRQTANTLRFQAEVFARQVTTHYSNLAVMGIQLSERTGEYIDRYLQEQDLRFDMLRDDQTHIAGVQEALIDQLHQKLLETDCSGAFILLDTQVNSRVENAEFSRSGLYLQRSSLDSTDTRILLYRGLTEIGKRHDAMPHRKWRLEFDTAQFPGYTQLRADAALPLTQSYRLTDVVTLPGTSERVMLLTVPVFGGDGTCYGLCGLELSESYFKYVFAQPSELNRAVFCLSRGEQGMTAAQQSLSAGILDDYYLAPQGQFRTERFGSGLFSCQSEEAAYVGVIQTVCLCPGGELYSVSALMPKQDYNRLAVKNGLNLALLLGVLTAFAALCCLYFSKRYLRPLKQSIDQIHQKEYATARSRVAEIEDLFAFLAEQDRQREAALAAVQQEKVSVEAELAQIQNERQQDKQALQRLAYSRKTEVDPEDYENFRRGIQDLTATERRVFDYYLAGKSFREITELMGVKESTVRFHNRNIYVALGVNSLKQLLRYAAIMAQDEQSPATAMD